jgi:hypothetical protein
LRQKCRVDTVDTGGRQAPLEQLRNRGYFPISLSTRACSRGSSSWSLSKPRITSTAVVLEGIQVKAPVLFGGQINR